MVVFLFASIFIELVVLSLDLLEEVFLVLLEHGVPEAGLMVVDPGFVEVVHVELNDIGGTCLTKEV